MAVFITKCPHCLTDKMSFAIFGSLALSEARYTKVPSKTVLVGGECSNCHKPVSASLRITNPSGTSFANYKQRAGNLTQAASSLDELHFELDESWPQPALISVPGSLPTPVERAFVQAERNYLMPDCEEAAATMYRRSLDVALKDLYPEYKGMLEKKLKALVDDKTLPPKIAEWAHEVRLIGNDGAHDLDGVSKEDLDSARAFIDTVLRYLFTLPAQIDARKTAPPPPASNPA